MKRIVIVGFVLCMLLTSIPFSVAAAAGDSTVIFHSDAADGRLCETEIPLDFSFAVEQQGKYQFVMEYQTIPSNNITPQVLVELDGTAIGTYDLPRIWAPKESSLLPDGRYMQDGQGNEIMPEYEEITEWQMLVLPSDMEIAAGSHAMSLTIVRGSVRIRTASLRPVGQEISYNEYCKQFGDMASATESVFQEAELISRKSHLELPLFFDRTSPQISPNDPVKLRYNLLGGSGFATEGQWVEWEIDVPETGLYVLDFCYRQNVNRGLSVKRQLLIDGEIPFAECTDVEFSACDGFNVKTVGTEAAPYQFLLEKGKHTLRMEVVLAGYRESLAELKEVVQNLNMLYSKIMVIVGENPDAYRDYGLVEHIDGLKEILTDSSNRLSELAVVLNKNTDKKGDLTARLDEAARMFLSMAEEPNKIPQRMDNFLSQINGMADLIGSLRNQPLELDWLSFRGIDQDAKETKVGFWEALKYHVESFVGSFLTDYMSIEGDNGADPLRVWISSNDLLVAGFAVGRDQAQIVSRLATERFSVETNCPVSVSLVTQDAILPALVSGKGPDVALFLPKDTLSNLYFRNALVDLSTSMTNYAEVEQRFYPSSMVSLKAYGKTFALPEAQSFNMMFIRKDLFNSMNLKAPETWDQFYTVLGRLQNQGMNAGIAEAVQIYEMFLLQNGGKLYNEERTKTQMTEAASIEAFSVWTDLYSKYSMPKVFDALNRFRTGQLPIVLAPAYFYGQLAVGAPEIAGEWEMYPIPGTANGESINHSESCLITGAAVMKHSDRQEDALRFLDWWTSDKTQVQFALENENRLGVSGRYYSASKAVLETLALTVQEQEALKKQWLAVDDVPRSVATYYVQRCLTNAFRRVVYNFERPRDVIGRYGNMADDELVRKNEEMNPKED